MAKKQVKPKPAKPRPKSYEPKVKFDGTFNDLVGISIKDAEKKIKKSDKKKE